jgi:hypothetical protein
MDATSFFSNIGTIIQGGAWRGFALRDAISSLATEFFRRGNGAVGFRTLGR